MKKLLPIIVISTLTLSACTTTSTITKSTLSQASNFAFDPSGGFIPVEPENARSMIEIVRNGEIQTVDIRTLSYSELRDHLTNSDQNVSISKIDTSGELSYLTGTITGEKGRYIAVLDFSNYIIDSLVDADKKNLGDAKIGIGLRLIADVNTRKRGINLGSILKIGLAASRQELTGRMSVKVIGLTSGEIINLLPGNFSSINETAIQSALEGMAAIKSKIYEEDTKVSAKILSVKLLPVTDGDTSHLQPAKL